MYEGGTSAVIHMKTLSGMVVVNVKPVPMPPVLP
jgi:hypothetical protein